MNLTHNFIFLTIVDKLELRPIIGIIAKLQ